MATPDAAAQINASGQLVLGDAGLAGGSEPLARRHPEWSAARVAAPAAAPLARATTFHRTPRLSIGMDCARHLPGVNRIPVG
jgi:hypothetical protein